MSLNQPFLFAAFANTDLWFSLKRSRQSSKVIWLFEKLLMCALTESSLLRLIASAKRFGIKSNGHAKKIASSVALPLSHSKWVFQYVPFQQLVADVLALYQNL